MTSLQIQHYNIKIEKTRKLQKKHVTRDCVRNLQVGYFFFFLLMKVTFDVGHIILINFLFQLTH